MGYKHPRAALSARGARPERDQVGDAGSSPKKVAPKPPVGVSQVQSGGAGGAGPASSARCQPSEPSEKPWRRKGASFESSEPEGAERQRGGETKAPKGRGRAGESVTRRDEGDGVAVTGGGGGTNVAALPGDGGGGKGWKLIDPLGLVGALNENRSAAPCSSRPNRAATSQRDRLGDGVLSPSE